MIKNKRSMMQSLVHLSLLLLAASGVAKVSYMIGYIEYNFRIPTEDIVVIDSSGGYVSVAERASVFFRNKTCVVKYAASAAFQIILPACKKRYYTPSGVLGFHSAHIQLEEKEMFSPWYLEETAAMLRRLNDQMTINLLVSGFPMPHDNIQAHIRAESTLMGEQLEALGNWIRPVSECSECPDYIRNAR